MGFESNSDRLIRLMINDQNQGSPGLKCLLQYLVEIKVKRN